MSKEADSTASGSNLASAGKKKENLTDYFKKFERELGQEVKIDGVYTCRYDGSFMEVKYLIILGGIASCKQKISC